MGTQRQEERSRDHSEHSKVLQEPREVAPGKSSIFRMPCSWLDLGSREAGGGEFSGRDSEGQKEISNLRDGHSLDSL